MKHWTTCLLCTMLKDEGKKYTLFVGFWIIFWLMLVYKAQQMKQTRDMTKHCEQIPRAFTSHNSFKFRIFKLKFSQQVEFFNVFLCFEIHRLSKLIIFFSMVCIEIQIGFESGRSKSIFFPIKTFFLILWISKVNKIETKRILRKC